MTILVSVDCVLALLRRWECGGAVPRLTHLVHCEQPLPDLAPEQIHEFASNPDPQDYCGPPIVPRPPSPPAGTPAVANAA